MTPERRKHVTEAWERYHDLPEAERAAFVAQLRAEQADVATELESLLRQPGAGTPAPTPADPPSCRPETVDFLSGADSDLDPATVDHREPATTDASVPRQIGRYAIDGVLGEGGMGMVYRGRDPDLKRHLAIKVLKVSGGDDAHLRRRFLEEAQIMGRLQHPGVAPIHEIGTLSDGRPFFAMKQVHGQTLAAMLRERESGIGNRESGNQERGSGQPEGLISRNSLDSRLLHIFEQVCQTLAYAHSQGVLHRDLKPANIMVGAFGEVQVMDWGLAKQISSHEPQSGPGELKPEAPAKEDHAEATQHGQAMGTPAYMAPEQARGAVDEVDERADVFGLGAILCVILTGKPPFRGKSTAEILRNAASGNVTEAWAELESRGADAELIDLARHCLSPHRDARPRDAGAVAAAVAGYQQGVQEKLRRAELEKAQAEVKAAEQRKRQRWIVTAAAAGLLLIVGAAAGALLLQQEQSERAAEKRAAEIRLDAEKKAAAARRQADKELRHVQIEANIAGVVKNVQERLQTLDNDLNHGGVFTLLNAQQDWKARIDTAGALLRQAGNLHAGAEIKVDPGLARQLVALEKRLQQHQADFQLAVKLDRIHQDRSLWVEGKFDDAGVMQAYTAAFAGHLVLTSDPQTVAAAVRRSALKELLAAALDDWAYVTWLSQKEDQHQRILRAARLADPDPLRDRLRDPKLWRDREALKALAHELLNDADRFAALSPQSLQLLGNLLPRGTQEQEAWLRRAQVQYPRDFWLAFDLGNGLNGSKNHLEAEGMFRTALAVRSDAIAAWNNLGNALLAQRKFEDAVAAYHKAFQIDPKFAKAWYNIGIVLAQQRKHDEAVAAYRKALAIDPNDAVVWNNLATALYQQQKHEEAVAAYRKAVAIDANDATAWNNLGKALAEQRQLHLAEAAFRKAVAIDARFAKAWNNLGNVLADQRKLDEGVAAIRTALAIDANYVDAWYNLGNTLDEQRKLDEAVAAYGKALAIDATHAKAHGALGLALRDQGRFAEAVASLQRCLKLLAPGHPVHAFTVRQLRQCEQLLALEKRIPAVLKDQNAGAAEQLQLADLCQRYLQRHRDAVTLYTAAFAAEPKTVDDLRYSDRYNAACAAVLAASGKGKDADKIDAAERSKLRRQALDWLRADVSAYRKMLESQRSTAVLVQQRLANWHKDADLGGVREAEALTTLPEAERNDWRQLWTDVAALLKQARK